MSTQQSSSNLIDPQDLYLQCVDHMGQLERRLESLQEIDQRGASVEKLDVLKDLLADVGEFLRSHFNAQRFESSVPDIMEIGNEIGDLRKLVGKTGWSWLGIGKSNDANTFEIRQRYDQLQEQFMQFVVGHLIECVNSLNVDNGNKRSFLESIDAYSMELARIW